MAEVTIADVMQAYAADAVIFAKRRFDMDLDFSEHSLCDIDRILAERTAAGLLSPDTLDESEQEEVWTFCKMLGGYVGEVIIRNLGGTWQMKEIDSNTASVGLLAAGRIETSPPDMIWRALTEPYKSIASNYRTLLAILGRGEQSIANGTRIVKLPPLSKLPPESGSKRSQKPWWKFW